MLWCDLVLQNQGEFMATSTCPKCESTSFEMKSSVTGTRNSISGAAYVYSFVQCRSCGAVVGVVDHHHVPSLLQKIAAKLGLKL
jgi:predicted nucleic-acid-binding Zn-ribbon protein